MNRLAVTLGDPRGIGPEVGVQAALAFLDEAPEAGILCVGPQGQETRGLELLSVGTFDGTERSAGQVSVRALDVAVQLATAGEVVAVVTGPVSKPALHRAGWHVPGQTELLQSLTSAPSVGMLMAAESTPLGGPLRVLLATTHLPLREVPEALSTGLIVEQARLLHDGLRDGWRIEHPRIGICGLNPHASDGGLFGDEEVRILKPAVAALRSEGLDTFGPLPADTVFVKALRGDLDAVVAPYHDVGMAAFKTAAFGRGVNVTLGLPIVRTSPDHGPAFDIAGRGTADAGSSLEALRLAWRLARRSASG